METLRQCVRSPAKDEVCMSSATDVPPAARDRWQLPVSVALIGLTLLAYEQLRHNDFIDLDDTNYVTGNPAVRAGLTGESVLWSLTAPYVGYWHPLTWLSLQLDVTLFGLDARGVHFTNLVLHTATSVL